VKSSFVYTLIVLLQVRDDALRFTACFWARMYCFCIC